MFRAAFFVLAVASCAPMLKGTLPEHCQSAYDACLNSCPNPPRAPPGTWQADVESKRANQRLQPDVADCTNDCNRRAEKCRSREGG